MSETEQPKPKVKKKKIKTSSLWIWGYESDDIFEADIPVWKGHENATQEELTVADSGTYDFEDDTYIIVSESGRTL